MSLSLALRAWGFGTRHLNFVRYSLGGCLAFLQQSFTSVLSTLTNTGTVLCLAKGAILAFSGLGLGLFSYTKSKGIGSFFLEGRRASWYHVPV